MVKFQTPADGWEELERIKTCRSAITTLMVPDVDLGAANRDKIAVLLDYLDEQEARAMQALRPMLNLAS